MMRVVHLIWSLSTGGVETMLVDIINEQVKHALVSLIVMNDSVDSELRGNLDKKCNVLCCGRKAGTKNPLPFIKLNFWLFKIKPDIIHVHGEGLGKVSLYPSPKVFTIHNAHSEPSEYKKYKALYSISKAVQEYTRGQGFESVVVENGIRVKDIRVKEDNSASETMQIVQIGRLYHPHKGQHILIEAMNIIVNEMKEKIISVDFIGDGSSYKYLFGLVRKYHLEEHVRFLGGHTRKYIYDNLCNYDLLIQPSISEGFGLTVAEAMVAGVPVLVSNVPGTMEVIGQGKYGKYFETDNPRSLADSILQIKTDGCNRKRLKEARDYAISNFDISHTAKTYLAEYKRILNKS